MTMAFNHLPSRTLKNIWKLWFGVKLHSTYVTGLCLYPFGVPKIVQLYSGLPEHDASCVETHWSS